MKAKTCCFTGHRNLSLEEKIKISMCLQTTIIELIQEGVEVFITGGALGFDTLSAKVVLQAKKKYPHIKLKLILPCVEQYKGWSEKNRLTYAKIFAKADEREYTAQNYFRGCMHIRNRRMVDESAYCICYLRSDNGGTAYTVKYAQENGLKILNLYKPYKNTH